jgi:hypothetical protein
MMRAFILTHRYVGIATCVLFVMWFASGVVMMYVGFPQLTAAERFKGLAPLDLRTAHLLPAQALAAAGVDGWPRELRLEMVLGRPAYIVHPWEGPWRTVFADDGTVLQGVSSAQAVAAARHFSSVPRVRYLGLIERDQWTVPNSLNVYRPLHHLALEDAAGTELYVSDRTGEVIRDTTRHERFWNWCGAVPHWLYVTELRRYPDVWRQVVLWVSGVGIVSAVTGIVVGVVRWRPRKRYHTGSTSPYHGMMRWHHVLGLAAAIPLLTWIVSGWLSLDPGRWASERSLDRAAQERYAGIEGEPPRFVVTPAGAWHLAAMQPRAKEVRLRFWEGRPHYVFASAPGERLRIADQLTPLPPVIADLEAFTEVAQRLLPDAHLTRTQVLHTYDFYWYAHHSPRLLPVLRLIFNDPQATWFHIDPVTGEVLERLDASRRLQRILFNALHSLDFPMLLAHRPAWDLTVIALSAVGLALSLTGLVVAWERLRG